MQALDGGVHVAGVSQIEQASTMTLEHKQYSMEVLF